MRVGVTLPMADSDSPDGKAPPFETTLEYARAAEAAGLDSVWIFDHLLFRPPGQPQAGVREGWTTLTALAPLVPRVELGSLVLCSSFRNPGLLAKMAATLDDLAGGRVVLGLGAGWHDPEYEAFGYPVDHRVGRFAEDLEIVARLLHGERVDFAGRWRQLDGAELLPRPVRRVPVLVAARGPRMFQLTARWADAWNDAWYGRLDDPRLGANLAKLAEACASIGRDPASIRRTIGVRLHEPGRRGGDERSTDASAAGLAELFEGFAELGFDDVLVWSIPKSRVLLERVAEARELHRRRVLPRRPTPDTIGLP